MAKHLQNIFVVSVSTLGSRVLGLVRDSLSYALFGLAAINSAFIFAWSLPNLFRRLLGEGALTSAFIPVLSEADHQEGRREAFRFLNQVLTRLGMALYALVFLGMAAMAGLELATMKAAQHAPAALAELVKWHLDFGMSVERFQELVTRWRLGFDFGLILMPYLLLVCLAAALLAALNMLGRFAVSAMSQVWLNLAMIASLVSAALVFGRTPQEQMQQMYWQCAGVLIGGGLQVVIPAVQLWRQGWRPALDWTASARLSEMMRLFLPGLFGASITQINILVSGCFALALNESARTVLYASSRLMELPLGMFTIAVATVLFPKIAMMAAQGDREGMGRAYAQGLRLIFAITVPAALGLLLLREPVVSLLFERGQFDAQAVAATTPVVALGALGIPFFSLATLATRGFHSLKDTRTPVRVAAWTFVVNLGLTLALMAPMGTPGLALANLSSSIFQSLALQRLLLHRKTPLARPAVKRALKAIAIAGAGMALFTAAGWWALRAGLGGSKWVDFAAVAGLIPVSVLVYLGLLRAAKFEEWPQLEELAMHALRPRQKE
ncbi:MAG: murein biosynthesis integral membrane protein MurJ [Opitutales bacterium]